MKTDAIETKKKREGDIAWRTERDDVDDETSMLLVVLRTGDIVVDRKRRGSLTRGFQVDFHR